MALTDIFNNIPVVGPIIEHVALPIVRDMVRGGKDGKGETEPDTRLGAPFFNQLKVEDLVALSGATGRSRVQQFGGGSAEQPKWFTRIQGSRGFVYISNVAKGKADNTYVSPGPVKAAQTFKKKKSGPTIKVA